MLVRLGWLSLDYLLALHGLKMFFKSFHGYCSKTLRECTLNQERNFDDFGHGIFFDRAREFLTYLSSVGGSDLFAPSLLCNDQPMRNALFLDLDRCWQQYEGAERIRSLHSS